MRILKYTHELKINIAVSFKVVSPMEVTNEIGDTNFYAIVAEVKRLGFEYEVIDRSDAVLESSK